ncbi:MAG: DUF4390 domain-containing protein [Betaproteobacteria bacterium]|nr:DUF4390 domain-containing protein [Betaproteobacteria bacterium]
MAFLRTALFALLCAAALAARAAEIEVRDAHLVSTEEGLTLDADFAFEFGPRLAEMIANGVPLYFVVEFELTRPRWWWFDEKTAAKRLQLRLSYHPLSRQYRLSSGLLQQQFATLEEALHVLRRVRNWTVSDRGTTLSDTTYEVALRMRLDITLLPKPFQVGALTSPELHLESPWKHFTFRPPPAPVENREPREAPAR